jgi:hypothetical protein
MNGENDEVYSRRNRLKSFIWAKWTSTLTVQLTPIITT